MNKMQEMEIRRRIIREEVKKLPQDERNASLINKGFLTKQKLDLHELSVYERLVGGKSHNKTMKERLNNDK